MSFEGKALGRGRNAVARLAVAAVATAAVAGLGACTTLEGNNAFTSFETFEQEVVVGTMQGIGLVPKESKEPEANVRAPLVMPGDTASLPSPTEDNSEVMIPEDSDRVTLDTSSLSEEDLRLLGRVRVADDPDNPFSNRTPEEQEFRRLIGQMEAYRGLRGGQRPLYMPPERYFTTVDDVELVCLANNGDLVAVTDPACPPEIRNALLSGQDS